MQSDSDANQAKVYIGNLPYSVTEDKLREMCQEFGEVTYCKIITQPNTDRSKGFGFAEFSSPEAAQAAIEALHGTEMDGRELVVNIARPRQPRSFDRSRGNYRQGGYDRNN
ncbi:MAG: RRM domain-containing RNA-binding protein [Microgenomates bacterium 39_7]|nr:MAG: RRM domain-containing RNA-binding protein [Microgenomates bacterium 39_7]